MTSVLYCAILQNTDIFGYLLLLIMHVLKNWDIKWKISECGVWSVLWGWTKISRSSRIRNIQYSYCSFPLIATGYMGKLLQIFMRNNVFFFNKKHYDAWKLIKIIDSSILTKIHCYYLHYVHVQNNPMKNYNSIIQCLYRDSIYSYTAVCIMGVYKVCVRDHKLHPNYWSKTRVSLWVIF